MERQRVLALVKLCEKLEIGESLLILGKFDATKTRFLKAKKILENKGIGLKSSPTESGRIITRDF
jgi:hypothetical protein